MLFIPARRLLPNWRQGDLNFWDLFSQDLLLKYGMKKIVEYQKRKSLICQNPAAEYGQAKKFSILLPQLFPFFIYNKIFIKYINTNTNYGIN